MVPIINLTLKFLAHQKVVTYKNCFTYIIYYIYCNDTKTNITITIFNFKI